MTRHRNNSIKVMKPILGSTKCSKLFNTRDFLWWNPIYVFKNILVYLERYLRNADECMLMMTTMPLRLCVFLVLHARVLRAWGGY